MFRILCSKSIIFNKRPICHSIFLRYKDKVLQEYPIDTGQTLTIGRNNSHDIVIDNLAASGTHARTDSVSMTFTITDLESTNVTFFNKEFISSPGLQNNLNSGLHILILLHRRAACYFATVVPSGREAACLLTTR